MDAAKSRTLAAATLLLGAAVVFAGDAPVRRVDERLLPTGLGEKQKATLVDFLASVKKPDRFIPASAKIIGTGALSLDPNPVPDAEIKEYLTSIVPFRPQAKDKPPDRAELFWYRPNPKRGLPGVTIRRVVNLESGEQVGEPEVLFNYPTPLAREELVGAVKIARAKIEKLNELFRDAEAGDVEVVPLIEQIKVSGAADGAPGDRVVNLQFLKKSTAARASVNVNLTRETVRDVSAP